MYDDLVEFLQESVTPFHAAATAESWLRAAGFTRLEEADYWNLEPGKGYYTTRNGSSVVAWRVPDHAIGGWRIVASHSDSPSWKIKADTVENDGCRRLSVEGYGGMIMSTLWPRVWTAAKPNSASAPAFQARITPARSMKISASATSATIRSQGGGGRRSVLMAGIVRVGAPLARAGSWV